MENLESIRKQLQEALEAPSPNFARVLELSGALARQDTEHLRFSVDASHIARLGRELVARQETALAELIKNGYDADAKQVDLLFNKAERSGGTLEVWDNGLGMTREQLIDGFMRLSTPDKVERPISPRFGRRRAGRKGIGRFAAQRLGTLLTVITQTKEAEKALRLTINWDHFLSNRDLTSIANEVTDVDKQTEQGTSLFIENLRDSWSDAQIQRAARYVADLIQPFPLHSIEKSDSDPGFKATFARQDVSAFRVVADDWTLYFEHALAEINGWVTSEGLAYFSLKCPRYEINREAVPVSSSREGISRFPSLEKARFRSFYFIDGEMPKQGRSRIRAQLREGGGIRLYRNGFRVLPYGERFDDWLGLDESTRARTILPPHANNNFLGFVEVDDPDGTFFEETSSREGLVENDAYRELQQFVSRSLAEAVKSIAEARGRKKTTGGKSSKRKGDPVKSAQAIAAALTVIEEAIARGALNESDSESFENIRQRVLQLGQQSRDQLEELGMLRVLASMGLTVGEFTHEVSFGFSALEADVQSLLDDLSDDARERTAAVRLQSQLDSLKSYIHYFDVTLRDNVVRELAALELRDIIAAFKAIVQPRIDRERLDFRVDIRGHRLFTRPMHRSEWNSILVNLFTNSVKAIRRAGTRGAILISAGRKDDDLFVEFSDNGDGIPGESAPFIFDAFFTTTSMSSPFSSDLERLTGMGLGLKLVKDIVETADGSIRLVEANPGYTTCFRIEIPQAREEEIEPDGY